MDGEQAWELEGAESCDFCGVKGRPSFVRVEVPFQFFLKIFFVINDGFLFRSVSMSGMLVTKSDRSGAFLNATTARLSSPSGRLQRPASSPLRTPMLTD